MSTRAEREASLAPTIVAEVTRCRERSDSAESARQEAKRDCTADSERRLLREAEQWTAVLHNYQCLGDDTLVQALQAVDRISQQAGGVLAAWEDTNGGSGYQYMKQYTEAVLQLKTSKASALRRLDFWLMSGGRRESF